MGGGGEDDFLETHRASLFDQNQETMIPHLTLLAQDFMLIKVWKGVNGHLV